MLPSAVYCWAVLAPPHPLVRNHLECSTLMVLVAIVFLVGPLLRVFCLECG